jgi:hypothetical protein
MYKYTCCTSNVLHSCASTVRALSVLHTLRFPTLLNSSSCMPAKPLGSLVQLASEYLLNVMYIATCSSRILTTLLMPCPNAWVHIETSTWPQKRNLSLAHEHPSESSCQKPATCSSLFPPTCMQRIAERMCETP